MNSLITHESIELVISTMNYRALENSALFENDFDRVVVINQLNMESDRTEVSGEIVTSQHYELFDYVERGLSLSRNRGIANSECDWLVFADDDLVYNKDVAMSLRRFCNSANDLVFFNNSHDSGPKFRENTSPLKLIFGVTSWTFAVKREFIIRHSLEFDTRFGLGSKYISTEENSFVLDTLEAGARYSILPQPLVTHQDISTGYKWNYNLAVSKGAFFARNKNKFGSILPWIFCLKKLPTVGFTNTIIFLSGFYKGWKQFQ